MTTPQDSVNTLPEEIKKIAEKVLISRIKDIGTDHQTYTGFPSLLMTELTDAFSVFIAQKVAEAEERITKAAHESAERYVRESEDRVRREQIEKDAVCAEVIEDALFGEDNSGTISRKIRSQLTPATTESSPTEK